MVIVHAVVGPPTPIGGSAAQKAAETELKHGEYHHDSPGPLARAVRWLGDKLDSLFSGGGGSHALTLLLVIVLAAAIVLAIRAGVPRRLVRKVGDVDPLAPIATHDHRRLAAQYAAEGRRAEALREWLRATVRAIEERGVLLARPGRTGAATAREAGAALPTAAVELAAATAAFDEVWFGGRDATDADVAHARAAANLASSAHIDGAASAPSGLAIPW